jgi:hypothetical protein
MIPVLDWICISLISYASGYLCEYYFRQYERENKQYAQDSKG